jgi:hypothetical protein
MHWTVVLFALIPVGLGCVFILIATIGGARSDWQRAQGWAFNRFQPGLSFRGQQYAWQGPDGVVREGRSIYRGIPLREGSPLTVLYDPRNPQHSRMDSVVHSGTVFIIVGWCLVALGVVIAAVLSAIAFAFPPS